MRKLILSAGHNPTKTGAHWKELKEHEVATAFLDTIMEYLASRQIYATRIPTSGLTQKVANVNQTVKRSHSDCLAVELHFNSVGTVYVEGTETLYYPGSNRGKKIATTFNDTFFALAGEFVKKNRGVKEGWYRMDKPGHVDYKGDVEGDEVADYWLRKTICPSLILEPCFMCQLPTFADEWDTVARAIADALIEASEI